jgi:hypothetical protein
MVSQKLNIKGVLILLVSDKKSLMKLRQHSDTKWNKYLHFGFKSDLTGSFYVF